MCYQSLRLAVMMVLLSGSRVRARRVPAIVPPSPTLWRITTTEGALADADVNLRRSSPKGETHEGLFGKALQPRTSPHHPQRSRSPHRPLTLSFGRRSRTTWCWRQVLLFQLDGKGISPVLSPSGMVRSTRPPVFRSLLQASTNGSNLLSHYDLRRASGTQGFRQATTAGTDGQPVCEDHHGRRGHGDELRNLTISGGLSRMSC